MSNATKKKSEKLYHSNLREMGPTDVAFKSDPVDGRYGPYCFVRLRGENDDRLFTLDSEQAKQEVQRIRNIAGEGFVQVEAAGAKDQAVLQAINLTPAPPGTPGAAEAPAPQPQNGPPPNEWPEDTQPAEGADQRTVEEMMDGRLWACLRTTGQLWERFHDEFNRYPSEQEQKVAVTLFIQGR